MRAAAFRFAEREVVHRVREVVASRVVICQYLVELVETIGVEPFERGGGPSVEDAAASLEEAVVRDLLRQTVPETVRALGALARLVEKLQSLELLEPQHGRSVTFPRRFEQTLREVPAEHRCGLERPFRRGVETVDPCRDDLLNRPWHVDGSSFRAPFARGACQLLQEEWIAFGAAHDRARDLVTGHRLGEQVPNEMHAVGIDQSAERELRDERLADQRRAIAGPVRRHQQHRPSGNIVDELGKELLRRPVEPVEILHDEDEWSLLAVRNKHQSHGFEDPALHRRRIDLDTLAAFDADAEKIEK